MTAKPWLDRIDSPASQGATGVAESKVQRFVRWHFGALVWLTIAQSLFEFVRYVTDPSGVWLRYFPFTVRVLAAPLLLAFAQLALWFRFYRRGGQPARLAATAAGVLLAVLVIVQVMRSSIGTPIDPTVTRLYGYAAFAHLLYGVLGSPARA